MAATVIIIICAAMNLFFGDLPGQSAKAPVKQQYSAE
jgi:hypothetical protein